MYRCTCLDPTHRSLRALRARYRYYDRVACLFPVAHGEEARLVLNIISRKIVILILSTGMNWLATARFLFGLFRSLQLVWYVVAPHPLNCRRIKPTPPHPRTFSRPCFGCSFDAAVHSLPPSPRRPRARLELSACLCLHFGCVGFFESAFLSHSRPYHVRLFCVSVCV